VASISTAQRSVRMQGVGPGSHTNKNLMPRMSESALLLAKRP
jgi:hypothetical protein